MARGKNYTAVKEKVSAAPVDVATAVTFLKEHAGKKFDQTVEVHVHLGIDHTKSDQTVRTMVNFPAGAPKPVRVAVIAADAAQQEAAKAAGATLVGGEELIGVIELEGGIAADVVVATPALMPKVARVARVLGPKGLMPNPKTGTVSPDPAALVRELAAGRATIKMDALGNIHEAVAKLSWETDKIVANVTALLEAVRTARPAATKGAFLKSVSLKATMSPSIRIAV